MKNKQKYLVYEVLFNPYTGDMILMREEWSSLTKVWNKRPNLIARHIPNNESDQYQILATAEPQGCVFQKVETEIVEGDTVDTHLGKCHVTLFIIIFSFKVTFTIQIFFAKLLLKITSTSWLQASWHPR